ncbi:MAG: hypothetical protein BGO39_21085 [Chloroflexi bacterium 54-19]|nr:MAG: hypothetical protein BGO39_21085 [Chloroflexi bacterium 54-19]
MPRAITGFFFYLTLMGDFELKDRFFLAQPIGTLWQAVKDRIEQGNSLVWRRIPFKFSIDELR